MAVLPPLLTLTPASAHAHSLAPGPDMHSDFCSAVTPASAAPAAPLPSHREQSACNYCPGCTGCAGGSAALPAPIAPSLEVERAASLVVTAEPPATKSVEVVTARPRGPPARA